MNQEFENDPLLLELKNTAGKNTVPNLGVDVLFEATRTRSRRYKLPLTLVVAGVAAVGVFVTVPKLHLFSTSGMMAIASPEIVLEQAQKDAIAYGDGDTPGSLHLNYAFSSSDQLENTGEPVNSYLLGPNKSAEEIMALLKEYFGIAGAPRQVTDSYTNGVANLDPNLKHHLTVGDEVKQASAFPMGEDGAVGFYYSDTSAESRGTGEAPTKAEATAEVRKLCALFGLTVEPSEVHFVLESKDYLAAVVKMRVDGRLTPINWVFAWRDKGKVSEFSGTSTTFQRQATPAIVEPSEAVSRAGEQNWKTEAVGVAPNDWYQLIQEGLPTPSGAADPKKKVPVVITKTEIGLGMSRDGKGSLWLLPSYLLYTEKGYAWSVIAVRDFRKQ